MVVWPSSFVIKAIDQAAAAAVVGKPVIGFFMGKWRKLEVFIEKIENK